MPDAEVKMVGALKLSEAERVLADVREHPGGYDLLRVVVYEDGTGELRSSDGVSAPIRFE